MNDNTLQRLKEKIARMPVRDASESTVSAKRRPPGYPEATSGQIPAEARTRINDACNAKRWPLLLSGSYGSGKTCAAACLYGEFGKLPMWYRCDDLLLQMATGRNGTVTTEYLDDLNELSTTEVPYGKFVKRLTARSAVFLDDLGIREPTESMYQAFFNILEWRKNKPLIITSNKSIPELAKLYDDRVADRIAAGTLIRFTGKSRRQKGKQ